MHTAALLHPSKYQETSIPTSWGKGITPRALKKREAYVQLPMDEDGSNFRMPAG
jgi:hypothetical protein